VIFESRTAEQVYLQLSVDLGTALAPQPTPDGWGDCGIPLTDGQAWLLKVG
jgi:hypothetical protein